MPTTPQRKVTNDRVKSEGHHPEYDGTPGFFGDMETLERRAKKESDDYEGVTPQSTVEGNVREVDMSDIPGREATGWPKKRR